MAKTRNAVLRGNVEDSEKESFVPMSKDSKLQIVAEFTDEILTQLVIAFVQVVKNEKWTKRDLARITGLNETGIGHVLSGRRKNLTAETIAILARAMLKRPRLVLEDLRAPARAMTSVRRGDKLRGPRPGSRPRRTGK